LSNAFEHLSKIRPRTLREGVTARAVVGERMTLAVVDLAPDSVVPMHNHENEQLGFVLQGSVTMQIAGGKRELKAGDTYTIPSNVPHEATAGPQGATVVDVFAPLRADWEKLDRLDPFPPDWPPS